MKERNKTRSRTRPNPKTYTIIDKCPDCGREYGWNGCTDTYDGAQQQVVKVNQGLTSSRILTLEICSDCQSVIAVQVDDHRGALVYVPTTKAL